MNSNYLQTEEPDYEIKIGVKDGNVCKIDWSGLIEHEILVSHSSICIWARIIERLSAAIKFLERIS